MAVAVEFVVVEVPEEVEEVEAGGGSCSPSDILVDPRRQCCV